MCEELLQGPSNEVLDEIRRSLGENQDRLETNLKAFEDWIDCQKHLPKNYDKSLLKFFLRGCKHDLREAQKKFELYFVARTTIPEIYTNRKELLFDMDNQRYIRNSYTIVSPKLTDVGNRVSFFGVLNDNVNDFDTIWHTRFCWLFADYRLVHDQIVAGEVFVFDAHNFTPLHATKFLTAITRKTISLAQTTYPFRIREVHIVNAPVYLDALISMVKVLLKEKLRQRVIVHRGTDTLLEYIPAKCLPIDFGGNLDSIVDIKHEWLLFFKSEIDWFLDQEDIKCSKPIPKDLTDKFLVNEEKMEGTFRKLQID